VLGSKLGTRPSWTSLRFHAGHLAGLGPTRHQRTFSWVLLLGWIFLLGFLLGWSFFSSRLFFSISDDESSSFTQNNLGRRVVLFYYQTRKLICDSKFANIKFQSVFTIKPNFQSLHHRRLIIFDGIQHPTKNVKKRP
jgi:hypothetical protein